MEIEKKVLVFDDQKKNLEVAEKSYKPLVEEGWEIYTSHSPDEVLDLIGTNEYDVLVTDLFMGYELFDSLVSKEIAEMCQQQRQRAWEFVSNPDNSERVFEYKRNMTRFKNKCWPIGYDVPDVPLTLVAMSQLAHNEYIYELKEAFIYPLKNIPVGSVLFEEAMKQGLEVAMLTDTHRHRLSGTVDIRTTLLPLFLEFPSLVEVDDGIFYFDESKIHTNADKSKEYTWFYGGGYNEQYFSFIPEVLRDKLKLPWQK
jgi:CheY-like chemotaxis protein